MLVPWGINPVAVPAGDGPALERAIRETSNLRVVLIESPANPTLRMTDIAAAVRAAAIEAAEDLMRAILRHFPVSGATMLAKRRISSLSVEVRCEKVRRASVQ